MFPRFDLAAFEGAHQDARHALARDLDLICRDTGFLVLEGHGVDPLEGLKNLPLSV
jgi:isopenicillin N synthase-like dioxygenase